MFSWFLDKILEKITSQWTGSSPADVQGREPLLIDFSVCVSTTRSVIKYADVIRPVSMFGITVEAYELSPVLC